MNDIRLRRIAVADRRHVANVDHAAVDHLDRQIAQRTDVGRRVVELDRVLEAADLLRTDGIDQILSVKGIGNILGGQAAGVQRRCIEIDLDLPRLAAIGIRQSRPRHCDEAGADHIETEVGEVLLRQTLAAERQLQNRNGRCVIIHDHQRR